MSIDLRSPFMGFVVCVICLFTGLAFAQSQSEMNQDAARDAAKADVELNKAYKKLLGSLDDEGMKLLKEAQRAWIAFRDAEAKRSADEARGGSMAPMLYSGALTRLTKERIQHLQDSVFEEQPEEKPKPVPEPEDDTPDGAKTQAQAAQLFFDAYKAHNRNAAHAVAEAKALDKLVWSKDAGDAEGLRLMDNTHIYYEGVHIELKMKQNEAKRWIISDVKLYAD